VIFLGKYNYLIDAYFDFEKDMKNKVYNPLIYYRNRVDYEDFCYEILTLMISETAKEYEKLPCVEDVEILKNILYGGVWSKYNLERQKKEKELKS
jgi:hypothetical protein